MPTMQPPRPGKRPARHPRAARSARIRHEAPVVAVVAAGGAIGAAGRHGASLLWPTAPAAFPWTTLLVNVTGCALMGVFMVVAAEVWWRHRLLRPFIGTGILGGYTTFSAYTLDFARLIDVRQPTAALTYLVATVTAALTATWIAAALTRLALRRTAA